MDNGTNLLMRTQRYIRATSLGKCCCSSLRGVSAITLHFGSSPCRFIPRPLGSFTRDQEMEPLKEVRKLCRPRPLANYIGNVEIELATARFDQEPWSLVSTQYSPTVMKILGNEIFVMLAYCIAGNFCKLLAAVTKGCHAPTFCREAFMNSHKTSKFAKVISRQSFLL